MVEFGNGRHERLALRARAREPDGISEFHVGNINGGLHDSKLPTVGILEDRSERGACGL